MHGEEGDQKHKRKVSGESSEGKVRRRRQPRLSWVYLYLARGGRGATPRSEAHLLLGQRHFMANGAGGEFAPARRRKGTTRAIERRPRS